MTNYFKDNFRKLEIEKPINKYVLEEILEEMKKRIELEAIFLKNTNIGRFHKFANFVDIIVNHKGNIKTIYFLDCYVTDDNTHHVAKIIAKSITLENFTFTYKYVDIYNVNLKEVERSEKIIKPISKALSKNRNMHTLDLSGNIMDYKTSGILITKILQAPKITNLDLSFCFALNKRCTNHIAKLLKSNHHIKNIKLNRNYINENCLNNILEALDDNTTLEEISLLWHCCCSPEKRIIKFLKSHPKSSLMKCILYQYMKQPYIMTYFSDEHCDGQLANLLKQNKFRIKVKNKCLLWLYCSQKNEMYLPAEMYMMIFSYITID